VCEKATFERRLDVEIWEERDEEDIRRLVRFLRIYVLRLEG
jgi:hypothetical protein